MDKDIEFLMNEVAVREQIVENYEVYGATSRKSTIEVIKNFSSLNVPLVDNTMGNIDGLDENLLKTVPEGRLMQILVAQANSLMVEIYNRSQNKSK